MSTQQMTSGTFKAVRPAKTVHSRAETPIILSAQTMPAQITRAASKQTYYTVRFLVDRERILNAYRAYAYFRWVDDTLDGDVPHLSNRLAFLERQQALVDSCYQDKPPRDLTPQERMLVELVASDERPNSGLRAYVENMMAVMTFDANRRGHMVSQHELDDYNWNLATAVSEAMHYFIGHDDYAPAGNARYVAAAAAHITHMLRDTYEDVAAGYFNIPREYLEAHHINAWDIASDAYREWVASRVELARRYFEAGKNQLAQVENRRCRLAGYAYMGRFTGVLEAIARDGYLLRPDYRECKSLKGCTKMLASVLSLTLWNPPSRKYAPAI